MLALADVRGPLGNDVITADGACEGVILDAPRGTGGFGYDPLFFAPELGKTFAEAGVGSKKITIEIPGDRISSKLAEQFDELQSVAQLPGFRPGKAPRSLLEKRFAEKTFAKARDELPQAVRGRVSLQFVQSGDAAATVCEYARQHGFDLLALGRHGTGGVLHPRLGHVAATAARKADLPVLLAP